MPFSIHSYQVQACSLIKRPKHVINAKMFPSSPRDLDRGIQSGFRFLAAYVFFSFRDLDEGEDIIDLILRKPPARAKRHERSRAPFAHLVLDQEIGIRHARPEFRAIQRRFRTLIYCGDRPGQCRSIWWIRINNQSPGPTFPILARSPPPRPSTHRRHGQPLRRGGGWCATLATHTAQIATRAREFHGHGSIPTAHWQGARAG